MQLNKAVLPKGAKSPTSLAGKSDIRDEIIYSSLVVAHAGTGQQKLFTVPQGQAILRMAGTGIAPTQVHHLVMSELTTNLEKAGEFGAGLGDASVRSISLCLETAAPLAAGGYAVFGATPQEVCDVLGKSYFQFKVGGKVMTQAPVFAFPASGGANGVVGISTTNNASTVATGVTGNGNLYGGRKLKVPIQIGRNDTVVGVIGTGNSAAYAFSVQANVGQSTLLTCLLGTALRGDVR
jgi:hypothetical protein